jgi:hypothetical protein
VLQHPETMNYTVAALRGLRTILAEVVSGHVGIRQVRQTVSREAAGANRVTRRPGEAAENWQVSSWPMTVADVLAGGPSGYADRVAQWARSICQTLDEVS